MMRRVSWLAAAFVLAAAPARAGMGVMLNTLEPADDGCRLVFALSNRTGHTFDAYGLTLAVLDRDGTLARRIPARTRGVPAGVITGTSFVVYDVGCDRIGAVRLEDIFACSIRGGGEVSCARVTAPSSRARVPFER